MKMFVEFNFATKLGLIKYQQILIFETFVRKLPLNDLYNFIHTWSAKFEIYIPINNFIL